MPGKDGYYHLSLNDLKKVRITIPPGMQGTSVCLHTASNGDTLAGIITGQPPKLSSLADLNRVFAARKILAEPEVRASKRESRRAMEDFIVLNHEETGYNPNSNFEADFFSALATHQILLKNKDILERNVSTHHANDAIRSQCIEYINRADQVLGVFLRAKLGGHRTDSVKTLLADARIPNFFVKKLVTSTLSVGENAALASILFPPNLEKGMTLSHFELPFITGRFLGLLRKYSMPILAMMDSNAIHQVFGTDDAGIEACRHFQWPIMPFDTIRENLQLSRTYGRSIELGKPFYLQLATLFMQMSVGSLPLGSSPRLWSLLVEKHEIPVKGVSLRDHMLGELNSEQSRVRGECFQALLYFQKEYEKLPDLKHLADNAFFNDEQKDIVLQLVSKNFPADTAVTPVSKWAESAHEALRKAECAKLPASYKQLIQVKTPKAFIGGAQLPIGKSGQMLLTAIKKSQELKMHYTDLDVRVKSFLQSFSSEEVQEIAVSQLYAGLQARDEFIADDEEENPFSL